MRKIATALYVAVSFAGSPLVLAEERKATADAPKGEISQTTEVKSTVTAIDQKTRMVTLKSADGKESTFYVDERARNLPQVKVGDVVKLSYVEALAWKVNKSHKTAPDPVVEAAATRTQPGAKPGGTMARRISITTSIEAIDLANGTVTLKGPDGNSHTIKARNPTNLKKVKVGDLVDITYAEFVALKVEPAAK